MTDGDLVRFFDPEIFSIYEEAKELYLDVPVFALLKARHINTLLIEREISRTEALKPRNTKTSSPHTQVNALKKVENYPNILIDLFHQIRINCNRAAHLEENQLSHDEFSTLAKDTLKQICDVIACLDSELGHLEPTRYEFTENTLPLLKDLLYLATVEQDTQAKIKAGKILSECWILETKNNAYKREKIEKNNGFIFDNYQRKLAYEFLHSAAFEDNNPEAIFYLALLLKHRWIPNRDSIDWSEVALNAAKLGNEQAKRFWGYNTILSPFGKYMSEESTEEQELALVYVKEAASEHGNCQMLLSRLYTDGHLVEQDHKKAEKYLQLAAENGESIAQYKYADLCFNRGDTDKADELLLLSAQSGYKPALTRVLRNDDISYSDRFEAYKQYQMIDHRDGEWDTMELNTDIEIAYAELVVEHDEIGEFTHAAILINNFLQNCMVSLPDDKFVHYLQLYKSALEGAKPTFQEIGNYALLIHMLDVYNAEYKKRVNQQQIAIKKFISSTSKFKTGRNEPCPCGSGLKHKNCCI